MESKYFKRDETIRWSCRNGDFIMWIRPPFFGGQHKICDVWEMRDSDYVTITNRWADLPIWFSLHHTEAAGSNSLRMMELVERNESTKEPLDGPNIWRLFAGDRLVWVRKPSDQPVKDIPKPELLELSSNALVVGESNREDFNLLEFGEIKTTELNDICRNGYDAAIKLELPRTMAADYADWKFGY